MTRRRTQRRHLKIKPLPGWALLLLGLTLGIASVLLTQLVVKRPGSTDGLAGLFMAREKAVEKPAAKPADAAPARPKLDFYTVLPEVETVLPERGKTRAAAGKADHGARYILQAGSFASFDDADQLKARLALQGLQAQIQRVTIEGKGEFHRVRLGPYQKLDDLDAASQQLAKLGIKTLRLRVKDGAGRVRLR